MKGAARFRDIGTDYNCDMYVTIEEDQKEFIKPVVNALLKKPETVNIEIDAKAVLFSAKGPYLKFLFTEAPTIRIEHIRTKRSLSQNSTLRGIERFIFIAENGYEPRGNDTYWIHEGLLEKYSTWMTNPRTGVSVPKRTSDPSMSTVEMAKIIEGALTELSSMDIPQTVLDSIGHDMKKLWEAWYAWRYGQEKDPLFEIEQTLTWEKYKELHPVCELCGLKGTVDNPIERMHIISAGSDLKNYEMPWNWIASHRSHHTLQHNEGWDIIERSYPHIVGKLRRARLMQGQGENI